MNGKRYNLFSAHLKQRFGDRVHKISVDAGFSCPNRGGTRKLPGCLFCDPDGSGAVGIDRGISGGRADRAGQGGHGPQIQGRSSFSPIFSPFPTPSPRFRGCARSTTRPSPSSGVVGLAVGTRPGLPARRGPRPAGRVSPSHLFLARTRPAERARRDPGLFAPGPRLRGLSEGLRRRQGAGPAGLRPRHSRACRGGTARRCWPPPTRWPGCG